MQASHQRFVLMLVWAGTLLSGCMQQATPQVASSSTPSAAPNAPVASPTFAQRATQPPAQTSSAASLPTGTYTPPVAANPTKAAVPTAPKTRTLALQTPPMFGEDVRQVQQRLLALGYRQVGADDGVFGPQTEASVHTFQTMNQLAVDGIVGPATWQRLRAADATPGWSAVPVAAKLCDEHVLLGASFQNAWLNNQAAGSVLRGGEAYRLYSEVGLQGVASGAQPAQRVPQEPPFGDAFLVALRPFPAMSATIALGGQWDALPRPISVITTPSVLRQSEAVVRTFLVAAGVPQPSLPQPTTVEGDHFKVWQTDLDGDGAPETIISAEQRADSTSYGGYSLVLVQRGADIIKVVDYIHTPKSTQFDWSSYDVSAMLDLNGDQQLEIVINGIYFESNSVSVHELVRNTSVEQLSAWCGV